MKYDIIIISAGNSFSKKFLDFYWSSSNINIKKVVTIALFPGVIFGDTDSIVARIRADILLCNNKMDFEVAHKIKKFYRLPTNIILYGLPVIKKLHSIEKQNIYFFDQVKIPETYKDRMYIIEQLIKLALNNPNENDYLIKYKSILVK